MFVASTASVMTTKQSFIRTRHLLSFHQKIEALLIWEKLHTLPRILTKRNRRKNTLNFTRTSFATYCIFPMQYSPPGSGVRLPLPWLPPCLPLPPPPPHSQFKRRILLLPPQDPPPVLLLRLRLSSPLPSHSADTLRAIPTGEGRRECTGDER